MTQGHNARSSANIDTETVEITSFSGRAEIVRCKTVWFTIKDGPKFIRIEALVKDTLPYAIKVQRLTNCVASFQKQGVKLFDGGLTDSIQEIELMLGSDPWGKLITGITREKGFSFL